MTERKRLEFSPKSKVLACLRYYPGRVQAIIACATGGDQLTNEIAKQILPSIFEQIKCVGLSEIGRAGRCDSQPSEVDHIMANEVKPDNTPENGRPLCGLCHSIKSARDAVNAKKGRHIRKETKKSQKPKAKIRSRNNLTKQAREQAKEWKEVRK